MSESKSYVYPEDSEVPIGTLSHQYGIITMFVITYVCSYSTDLVERMVK